MRNLTIHAVFTNVAKFCSLKQWGLIEQQYQRFSLRATRMRSWQPTISQIICMSLKTDQSGFYSLFSIISRLLCHVGRVCFSALVSYSTYLFCGVWSRDAVKLFMPPPFKHIFQIYIYFLLFIIIFFKYWVPYYINFLLEYGNNGFFFPCPDFFDLIAGNKTYGHQHFYAVYQHMNTKYKLQLMSGHWCEPNVAEKVCLV